MNGQRRPRRAGLLADLAALALIGMFIGGCGLLVAAGADAGAIAFVAK